MSKTQYEVMISCQMVAFTTTEKGLTTLITQKAIMLRLVSDPREMLNLHLQVVWG
ncbi:MAG: hypothetical protein WBM99_06095 [Psychromonas sp.]